MPNDASPAGVLRGGLFSIADIKILICYIFSAINDPIPANMLANTLHYEGIANAFEVCDAIVHLERDEIIVQVNKKDDSYTVTPKGRNIAKTLATSLSMTVRDRAYKATLKMISLFKNAKDTRYNIVKENGRTYIECSALDSEFPFMSVKMMVTDEGQAQFIKKKFLENPAKIYSTLIEMLTTE